MARLLQPAFTRGEISQDLHARVDLALYQVALKRLRNFFVRAQGGVSNRSGTQYVSIAHTSEPGSSVLIPFIFSTEQAYILEFGEEVVRVFANGGYVQDPASSRTITNVTLSAALVGFRLVDTSAPHGYSTGDIVHIEDVVATGAYQVNGSWRITVVSASRFQINGAVSVTGSYVSGGTTAKDIQVVTPYQLDELADLRFTQSADVLTVTHNNHPQSEFRRLSATSFTFSEVEFNDGPFLDVNDDFAVQMYASAALGDFVTITATTSTGITTPFTADMVGSLIKLESRNLSNVEPWEAGGIIARDSGSTLGVLRRSDGKVYKCVTDATPSGANKIIRSGSVRPTHEFGVQSDGSGKAVSADIEREGVSWEYLHSGFGILRIDTYTSATVVSGTVLKRFPDDCVGGKTTATGPFTMTGDGIDTTLSIAGATDHNKYNYEVTFDGIIQEPSLFEVNATTDVLTFYTAPAAGVSVTARELSANNRTDIWYFGAWSDVQGYPAVVTYFQDRIFYAASTEQPQTIWASRTAAYNDFGVSVPIADDDSIAFTLNARQINGIRELIPLDKLIALTSSGTWKVTDGQDEVITPSTVGFKPQSYKGAKFQRSILLGEQALYIHNAGRQVLTIGYRYENDKFSGQDLNIAANHLFTKTLTPVDMDYAEEPDNLVHVVRSDGKMPTLTYDQEQQVTGWSNYDTLDGEFERVCSIPEDNDNAVYVIVNRTLGERTDRFIERFAPREIESVLDGVFLDCSSTFDGRNTSDTTFTLEFPVGPGTILITASAAVFVITAPPDLVVLTIEDSDGNSYTIRALLVSISGTSNIEVRSIADLSVDTQIALEGRSTTDWSIGFDTFSGLSHLEGATVTIFADGGVEEDQTVSGGQVVLDNPATVVHVGLRITCDFEPLEVNVIGSETVRDRAKHVGSVSVVLLQSQDIQVGPDADHLDDVATRQDDDEYDAAALVDGNYKIYIASTLTTEGSFFLRHDDPLPLTILAVIPKIEFGTDG